MKKLYSIFAAIILLISSCQKDIVFPEGAGPGSGKKTGGSGSTNDGLSGTTWRLSASTATIEDSGFSMDVDLFALLTPCTLDDMVTYNANGTATHDQGTDKCDPSTPQSETGGKWTLSSDKKTLEVSSFPATAGITSLKMEVLQLDAQTLKVRYITYINGPKSTTISTYTRVK